MAAKPSGTGTDLTLRKEVFALKLSVLAGYVGLGLSVGTLSGLLGIGGGVLMVPALVLLWGMKIHLAIGTSLAVMIPSALAGTLRHHYSYGNVDFIVAGLVGLGAVVGSFCLGAPLANYLPAETLRKVFGAAMIVLGFYYGWLQPYVAKLAENVG